MSENKDLLHRTVIKSRNGQPILIRILSDIDVSALQAFNEKLSEQTRSQFLPHQYNEKTILQYCERNRRGVDRIYVAILQNCIIGYFFLWDFKRPFPVLGIGISDTFQGQGLGKEMMNILVEDAKTAGSKGIILTTVLSNEKAFQLYLRMGFQYLGDTDNIAGDGRVVRERMMFLPLIEGEKPDIQDFEPPV
ncbi:MAG: GNAT family N-acetyltransferase [Bacteroidota bacterium]